MATRTVVAVAIAGLAAGLIATTLGGQPPARGILYALAVVGGVLIFGGRRAGSSSVRVSRTMRLSSPTTREAALGACLSACQALAGVAQGSVRADEKRGQVVARTRISRRSWGEKIVLRATSTTGADVQAIEVESRPLIPTVILDHGKNRENVDALEVGLAARLAGLGSQ